MGSQICTSGEEKNIVHIFTISFEVPCKFLQTSLEGSVAQTLPSHFCTLVIHPLRLLCDWHFLLYYNIFFLNVCVKRSEHTYTHTHTYIYTYKQDLCIFLYILLFPQIILLLLLLSLFDTMCVPSFSVRFFPSITKK